MFNIKSLAVILLALGTTAASAADVPTAEDCKVAFILKGKTDTPWKKVTLNAWNEKILPPIWIDKGGHFLSRVKERGEAAAIHDPGDLASFVLNAGLKQSDTRWSMFKVEGAKTISVLFDINKKSKKCELVTFLIETLQ